MAAEFIALIMDIREVLVLFLLLKNRCQFFFLALFFKRHSWSQVWRISSLCLDNHPATSCPTYLVLIQISMWHIITGIAKYVNDRNHEQGPTRQKNGSSLCWSSPRHTHALDDTLENFQEETLWKYCVVLLHLKVFKNTDHPILQIFHLHMGIIFNSSVALTLGVQYTLQHNKGCSQQSLIKEVCQACSLSIGHFWLRVTTN